MKNSSKILQLTHAQHLMNTCPTCREEGGGGQPNPACWHPHSPVGLEDGGQEDRHQREHHGGQAAGDQPGGRQPPDQPHPAQSPHSQTHPVHWGDPSPRRLAPVQLPHHECHEVMREDVLHRGAEEVVHPQHDQGSTVQLPLLAGHLSFPLWFLLVFEVLHWYKFQQAHENGTD